MSKLNVGIISNIIFPSHVRNVFNREINKTKYESNMIRIPFNNKCIPSNNINIIKYQHHKMSDNPIVGHNQLNRNINYKYIHDCIISGDLDYAISSERVLIHMKPLHKDIIKMQLSTYITMINDAGNVNESIATSISVKVPSNIDKSPTYYRDMQNLIERYYIENGLHNIGIDEALSACLKQFPEK